jgi:peptide/nickel transport system permease protein
MQILRLAGRRLAASIPTLILILIGVFLLLQLAPGDTVDAMMAQMGGGDARAAEELRRFYGLDLSVAAQLGNYLWRLVRSISAFSAIYGKPVAHRHRRAPAGDHPADDLVAVLRLLLRHRASA